jgi:hypothetical protein
VVRRAVILALAAGAAAAVVWLNTSLLIEAYGSGPPHYGRSTNMDKWSDPRPVLLLVDGAALATVLLRARRRPWRKRATSGRRSG